jgi:hypothetical protein
MSDDIPPVPAARLQPSASYSFTMRLHMPQQGGAFARVAQAIADAEAMLGAIDLVRVEPREVVRDMTVACGDSGHAEAVVRAVRDLEGVRVDSVSDRTFLMHKGGKIEVTSKLPLKTRDDLSMAYTPGVACAHSSPPPPSDGEPLPRSELTRQRSSPLRASKRSARAPCRDLRKGHQQRRKGPARRASRLSRTSTPAKAACRYLTVSVPCIPAARCASTEQ